MAIDRSDPDTGLLGDRCHRYLLAVAPDRNRGSGEDAFPVGRGVTSQSLHGGLWLSGCFGHPGGDRAT
jgi:hypothetical protein